MSSSKGYSWLPFVIIGIACHLILVGLSQQVTLFYRSLDARYLELKGKYLAYSGLRYAASCGVSDIPLFRGDSHALKTMIKESGKLVPYVFDGQVYIGRDETYVYSLVFLEAALDSQTSFRVNYSIQKGGLVFQRVHAWFP